MLSDLDSVSAKREVKVERVAGLRGGGAPSLVVLGGWGAVEGPARQVRGHWGGLQESRRQEEGGDRNQARSSEAVLTTCPFTVDKMGVGITFPSELTWSRLLFQWADSLWGGGAAHWQKQGAGSSEEAPVNQVAQEEMLRRRQTEFTASLS